LEEDRIKEEVFRVIKKEGIRTSPHLQQKAKYAKKKEGKGEKSEGREGPRSRQTIFGVQKELHRE